MSVLQRHSLQSEDILGREATGALTTLCHNWNHCVQRLNMFSIDSAIWLLPINARNFENVDWLCRSDTNCKFITYGWRRSFDPEIDAKLPTFDRYSYMHDKCEPAYARCVRIPCGGSALQQKGWTDVFAVNWDSCSEFHVWRSELDDRVKTPSDGKTSSIQPACCFTRERTSDDRDFEGPACWTMVSSEESTNLSKDMIQGSTILDLSRIPMF